MNFSKNLKKLRKDKNISQEQLAEELGVSRQSVSKWESDQAYPEMDKIILLCKLFNVSIDDLLNNDIGEVKSTKDYKLNLNNSLDSFLNFISRTIDLFTSLKFRAKLSLIIEQLILIFILYFVYAQVGSVIRRVIFGILGYGSGRAANFLLRIAESIYLIAFIILAVTILLHIFKRRYLDYHKVEVKEDSNLKTENTEVIKAKREDKVIIRDAKDSEYGIVKNLLRIMLIFIKAFAILLAVGASFSFVSLMIAISTSFLIIKSGFLFVGIFTMILAALVLNFVVLKVLYYFIVGQNLRKKQIGIIFLIGFVVFGLGAGAFNYGITKMNFVNDPYAKEFQVISTDVEMKDDLMVFSYLPTEVEYVASEDEDLKIIVRQSHLYDFHINQEENKIKIHRNSKDFHFDQIRKILNDINAKKILHYEQAKVTVYSKEENLIKLKANKDRYISEERERDRINFENNQRTILEKRINELEEEIAEKDERISRFEEEILKKEEDLRNIKEILQQKELFN